MKNEYNNVYNSEPSLRELIYIGKDWINYFFFKWKIILFVTIFGSAIGLAYAYCKKPVFTASLSFSLEDGKSGGGLGSALGLASSFGLDLGGGENSIFTGSNLSELFKSRYMVEKTLLKPIIVNGKEISLAEMYIRNNHWREKSKFNNLQFPPNADRRNFNRAQDSILGKIFKNLYDDGLTVGQKDKKVAIIYVDVHDNNELFAKYFTEHLVDQVSTFYVETKSKKSRENMLILERQTDSIRRELNSAITGVAVANDNTFNLNPALNVRRSPSARRQVDVQANTAILTELVKQTELAKVTLRKETPLIQIIDKPILPLNYTYFGAFKGIILGGLLGTFISIFILFIRRVYIAIEV